MSGEKLLIVEDDLELAQRMTDFLQDNGYQILHEVQGDKVVERVKKAQPDLVLLDWNLPGQDGLQVCRQLRAFYQKPIVMLTARDGELDEVLGLELGATDYLTKPVKPRVLLARIQKAFRDTTVVPSNAADAHELTFDRLSIFTQANRVEWRGEEVSLTSLEYQLFCLLAKNAGKPLSRDELFQQIKGREYDGFDRSLDVVIAVLRGKFEENAKAPKRIKTVWGKGYLFVPDAWL